MEESPKPKAPTTKDLLSKMDERLSALDDRLSIADAENVVLNETIANMRLQYEEDGFTEDPEAETLYDPFYSKRPYQIVGEIPPDAAYPEGQVLGWKNEDHREKRRGWRGWSYLSYGDKYTGKNGELLRNYITDTPPRLEGSSKMDNHVRRADSVLCRLDKRIFETRQKRRQTTSSRNVAEAGSGRTKVLRDGVEVVGAGLRDQDRPVGGFKLGEKQVVGEHHQKFPVRPEDNKTQEE